MRNWQQHCIEALQNKLDKVQQSLPKTTSLYKKRAFYKEIEQLQDDITKLMVMVPDDPTYEEAKAVVMRLSYTRTARIAGLGWQEWQGW